MVEKMCSNCKNLQVVVTQSGDYYCIITHEYYDSLPEPCDEFIEDNVTLREKEERVW